jgi:hypothetical protein
MGILGRPRRRKNGAVENAQRPARETDGAALLRRQLMGSDPVLARVAEEALLAEAASRGKTKSGPQDPRICAGFNASICALPPGPGQRDTRYRPKALFRSHSAIVTDVPWRARSARGRRPCCSVRTRCSRRST